MADWRDGAEYAPVERPFGFAAPRADALTAPEPERNLASDQPASAPGDYQPPQAAALDTLIPHVDDPRNPREPFDTAGSGFVGNTAWGAMTPNNVEPWDPRRPFVVTSSTSFPAPEAMLPTETATPSFAPPTGQPVVPASGNYPTVATPGYQQSVGSQTAPLNYPAPGYPMPAPAQHQWQQAPSQPQTPLMRLLVLALAASALFIPTPSLPLLAAWIAARYLRPRRPIVDKVLNLGFWAVVILGVVMSTSDPYGETYSLMSGLRFIASAATASLTAIYLARRLPQ